MLALKSNHWKSTAGSQVSRATRQQQQKIVLTSPDAHEENKLRRKQPEQRQSNIFPRQTKESGFGSAHVAFAEILQSQCPSMWTIQSHYKLTLRICAVLRLHLNMRALGAGAPDRTMCSNAGA